MASYTQGDTRVVLSSTDLANYQGNGSAVLDSRRTRPLWFDGRFLAARDLEREQNYFLQRQADLGRAPGFGVIDGLLVDTVSANGNAANGDTIVVQSGQGVTPAGELVEIPNDLTLRISDLAEQQNLDVQFGISDVRTTPAATRTGLYVIALRPVQFTANPITAYPTTVQGTATKRDGDIVEATAISLVPWPAPASSYDATTRNAALARQIFLTGTPGQLSDSLLPLAMVSMTGGAIEWLDPWLVRRETGSEFTGLRFGLTDPQAQQAFLLQYDSQLQQAVNTLVRQKLPARFPATKYFQALPPAGRCPLACIDANAFTQTFFPPQMDVRLSVVPDDELPALIEDSMSLPPIDLTLTPSAYANLTVFVLIPTPRQGFAALEAALPALPLTSVLPQVLSNRKPIDLLRFYQGNAGIVPASGTDNSSWQGTIGTQTYGYYIRRRSSASAVAFTTPPSPPTTTAPPTTPPPPTTSTTVAPFPTPTTARPTTSTTTTTPSPTTSTTTTTTPPTTSTTTTTVPPTTSTTTSTTTTTTVHPTTSTTTTTVRPTTTTTTTTVRPTTTTTRPPTTTVLTASVIAGSPPSLSMKATVSPSEATGTVTFMDGSKALGTGELKSGTAALALTVTPGNYVLTAQYPGDAKFTASTSPALDETVIETPT
jgi:hypothetical protein